MIALLWLGRVAVATLFVVAGILKFLDPTAFAIEIGNYRLFPELAPYIAIGLPFVEIAVGLAVIVPSDPWRRAGAAAASTLLVVFTVAVASAVARGMDVSCGCFGASSDKVSYATIARDLALVAAAVALVIFPRASAFTPPRRP
jgi:putative oxidoreductase